MTYHSPRPVMKWLVAALALVGLLAACGGSDADDAEALDLADAGRGFVGMVDGTDAFVAIVAGGGEAIVYVCDGDIAEWFTGAADAVSIDLTSGSGARIEATATADGYLGTVTIDGEPHAFEAVEAQPGAGLLRVTGTEADQAGIVGGWIVDNDGDHRGSLRVRNKRKRTTEAPSETVVVDGASFTVSIIVTPPTTPTTPPGVPIPYPNTGLVATRSG